MGDMFTLQFRMRERPEIRRDMDLVRRGKFTTLIVSLSTTDDTPCLEEAASESLTKLVFTNSSGFMSCDDLPKVLARMPRVEHLVFNKLDGFMHMNWFERLATFMTQNTTVKTWEFNTDSVHPSYLLPTVLTVLESNKTATKILLFSEKAPSALDRVRLEFDELIKKAEKVRPDIRTLFPEFVESPVVKSAVTNPAVCTEAVQTEAPQTLPQPVQPVKDDEQLDIKTSHYNEVPKRYPVFQSLPDSTDDESDDEPPPLGSESDEEKSAAKEVAVPVSVPSRAPERDSPPLESDSESDSDSSSDDDESDTEVIPNPYGVTRDPDEDDYVIL